MSHKTRRIRLTSFRRDRDVRFTLADRLLVTGQRLRANEPMVATTVALNFAAKWAQGGGR